MGNVLSLYSKKEIEKKLKSCDLGLARGSVALAEPSPLWSVAFDYLVAILRQLLSHCRIIHVGSTAVPGCWAKLILDIIIWPDPGSTFQEESERLVEAGFTAKGEYGIPGRSSFNFYDAEGILDYAHNV